MEYQVIYTFDYDGESRECEVFTGFYEECEEYINNAKDYLDINDDCYLRIEPV